MSSVKSAFNPPSFPVFHNTIKPSPSNETVSVRFSKEGRVDEWVRVKDIKCLALLPHSKRVVGSMLGLVPLSGTHYVCTDSLQILCFTPKTSTLGTLGTHLSGDMCMFSLCLCPTTANLHRHECSSAFCCAGTCLCTVCLSGLGECHMQYREQPAERDVWSVAASVWGTGTNRNQICVI